MKHNQKKINNFFFAIFALFLILGAAVPAAAETSIVWSQEIGNVAAADMSEDGSVIYAAVGSSVFVYDSAGVQQNVFTVGGTVVKLVCTADGSKAALYTDTNTVYFINNGALTWSESFTAITDIDISNVGNVLIVEGTQFHKYLADGSLEYDSSSGTFNLGVIDSNDEFAIVQSGNSNLQKYILSTTDRYWAKIGDNTFNTNFSDYQNLLILYTNPDQTEAIILSNASLGDDLWERVYGRIAVSDVSLHTTNANNYFDSLGAVWTQQTASAEWSAKSGGCSWVVGNKIFIGGGSLNDVWMSEDFGQTWTQQTASAEWSDRSFGCSWVVGNKMFIGGGYSNTFLNDVWMSEDFGQTWTQQTASAGWSARRFACSWVVDNKMFIGGGSSSGNLNDVWMSEDFGQTWTQQTASAGWSARSGGCSWVVGNKMFIGGGYSSSSLNDVWMSEDFGQTWTRQTASAGWSARRYACSWVVGNKMFIGGGAVNSAFNDVWMSEDFGQTWTQQTASAGWSARRYVCSWVVDNKIFIGGGYSSSGALNDVWMSDASLQVQPSSTGQTYIFYNYTGSNAQHTQTTYVNPVIFSGTYELRTKPILSIYNFQTTKSLSGDIITLSLSDRGDWLGTATTTRIYHDQITSLGFGTEYYAALGSTGTIYDIATANSAAMSILGQGQITDIYSMSASRVGTYTAGGAVEHVDIADKNALWAASGGEDGKVYVFSKDESSNWYLEYSSDSEDPITALKMSSRGELVLAGRTSSLTLYQTNTPEQADTNFWFTLYIYKDSDSYRQAAVNVSVYNINNQWQSFAEGLTDSSGKYVIQLTAGNTYKFDVANGQKVLVYQAAPSVPSQVVSIHTSPVSAALTYEAEWDPEIGGVTFDYMDSTGQTQTVIVKIIRTDTWETVYEQTYTGQQSIEQSVPIVDDTVGYKVELSASRSSGITRNTWFVSSSRDIVPIPLDTNVKNILFSCFLIFLAGLFSYLSAFRGAIVVCLSAIFFTYMGWLTIPWHWLVVAVVLAFVAGFTQRRT